MSNKDVNLSYKERMLVSNIIDMFINKLETKDCDAVRVANLFKVNDVNLLYKLCDKFINVN